MLFNSIHFLVYFPIVVGIYFATPYRWRWLWLLAASYYFYMSWKPVYVTVIWAVTLIDYTAGLMIGRASSHRQRLAFLILSIATNLGLLFTFKYFDFFNETVRLALGQFNVVYQVPALELILPLGVSFHTFQALSYTIDVYRGVKEPERNLGRFALFIAFFPQLVAGPIERATHLLPQLRENHDFDYARVTSGLKLMMWGFFKKLVIADRLAAYVNTVYDSPGSQPGTRLLIATYFFAWQIYCDFSGYSDIAVGAARVMGYDLTVNFERPYFSTSVREFWRRWHISLSSWFRDYLYVPLGGNRKGAARRALTLLFVFLVSGLWHGANWTFVVWGALHGLYVVTEVWTAGIRERLGRVTGFDRFPAAGTVLSVLLTFHLVAFAWIYFRATSMEKAELVISGIFSRFDLSANILVQGFDGLEMALAVLFIVVLECTHFVQRRARIEDIVARYPMAIRWACYYAVILTILLFGKFDEREFIYFQF